MKKMMGIAMLLLCILFSAETVAAQEVSESTEPVLTYALNSSETAQEISYVNEEDEEVMVSIEYVPSMIQISSGTYKVSKSVKGSWTLSFNVTVNSSNKITGASNLNLKALKGSILSSSLTYTSAKATCSFSQKAGTITSNNTVTASISNNELVVK